VYRLHFGKNEYKAIGLWPLFSAIEDIEGGKKQELRKKGLDLIADIDV